MRHKLKRAILEALLLEVVEGVELFVLQSLTVRRRRQLGHGEAVFVIRVGAHSLFDVALDHLVQRVLVDLCAASFRLSLSLLHHKKGIVLQKHRETTRVGLSILSGSFAFGDLRLAELMVQSLSQSKECVLFGEKSQSSAN